MGGLGAKTSAPPPPPGGEAPRSSAGEGVGDDLAKIAGDMTAGLWGTTKGLGARIVDTVPLRQGRAGPG